MLQTIPVRYIYIFINQLLTEISSFSIAEKGSEISHYSTVCRQIHILKARKMFYFYSVHKYTY